MTPETLAELLGPYIVSSAPSPPAPPDWPGIYSQLSIYLELILKWNARINLTAIRSPAEIVRRHFGESLFAGGHLGPCQTLLDFGSGAGFPGLPIQLMRPDVAVTLAESRTRKAAFLREAVRALGLSTEVFAGRVEAMPASRRFDAVALRAVDDMEAAVGEAGLRATSRVLVLTTQSTEPAASQTSAILSGNFDLAERLPIPQAISGVLDILQRR